jgi:hypothetical protein
MLSFTIRQDFGCAKFLPSAKDFGCAKFLPSVKDFKGANVFGCASFCIYFAAPYIFVYSSAFLFSMRQ